MQYKLQYSWLVNQEDTTLVSLVILDGSCELLKSSRSSLVDV